MAERSNDNLRHVGIGISSVVALITIISGLYAVLSQEVASVRRETLQLLAINKDLISDHIRNQSHPGQLVELAALKQQFVEVETQFKAARDRLEAGEAQLHDLLERAEKRLEERTGMLDARIQREVQLERERLQIQIDALAQQMRDITQLRPRVGPP